MSAILLALLVSASAPLGGAGPAAAAGGFLSVYGTFHPSDGIPDAAGLRRLRPYLSASLDKLLDDAAAAEARFSAKLKNAPPLIEGDLFSSLFEGASGWRLQACTETGTTARCPVAFTHGGAKPFAWTDTILLVATPSGWKVDDIAYGGHFRFGNTGRLSDTLKVAASEAP